MKILIFHPVLLPAREYGGVERVVVWLARGLVERGHEVWIGALEGSELPKGVRLLSFSSKENSAFDLLKKIPAGMDVVHFMAPPEAGVFEQLSCVGVLTVHGNGKPGEVFEKNTVFLSRDHARRHRSATFVYNGIDPDECEFTPELKENWVLFLSKTSWSVKNAKGAADLCLRAEVPLKIAGGSRPHGLRLKTFFSRQLSWEGAVGGEKKARLLARARALIFPVLWPEPFGLVVVEALMSGTPVIASPYGSLRELVPPQVGALLDPSAGENEWNAVLQNTSSYSPQVCRDWALENFHYRVMAERYEQIYRRVRDGKVLNAVAPVAEDWRMK